MIRSLDVIKNCGIFKDFNWEPTTGIQNFNEKNIIYGWNYSGKTTLSRIFSSIRDKKIHEAFEGGSFRVTADIGNFDSNNLISFPYEVMVFNSEYAKDNLRLEFDENINAIFFEVGDNAKLSAKIEVLENQIELINGSEAKKGKKEKYLSIIGEFEKFETLFTTEASRIKNDGFASLIEFTKTHLKKILNSVIQDLDSHIITSKEELSVINKTVKIEAPKSKIDLIQFEDIYANILLEVNEALRQIPSKKAALKILDNNIDVHNWVKEGVVLNVGEDNCLFCGNKIDEDRMSKLTRYFENEASQLKVKLEKLRIKLSKEEVTIQSLNIPKSINDFNDGLQKEFEKREIKLKKELKSYNTTLKKLEIAINKKSSKKIFSDFNLIFKEDNKSLVEEIQLMNNLIIKNNDFVENFDQKIKDDREKYKFHLVSLFLKESKYLLKKSQFEKAAEAVRKFDDTIMKRLKEIESLNSSKESDSEGCKKFNSFVQSFLSRDDIEIRLNESTKKFNLMRGKAFAKHLSEGEKMAISFSHFLVNLKSIEQKEKLKDYIIYIDDPISSLDSNHIFQINSLLKEIFFNNIPDPEQPKQLMWKLKCKQLFISTHNFEFLNLLKEMPQKHGFGKKGNKEAKYFISRDLDQSKIEKLPNVYNTFSSEYHFLFGEILRFTNNPDRASSSKLFTIPNIIRRFIEMYTLTKYPSNDEVDGRAEVVFGKKDSKRILKLLHYFSHFNSIDRIHKQSEFVADIANACDDLMNLIKTNDKMHYDALEASVI